MKNKTLHPLADYQVWILTHMSALLMGVILYFNPKSFELLILYSGYLAVFWLVVTLSLNPLKILFPQSILLKKLNQYRRELGVASFSHALVHLICFVIKRGSIFKTLPWLKHPAIIPVAFLAFPILLLLAVTSNKLSIKTMGFPQWKKLHKTVYIAEGAIIIHMTVVGHGWYALFIFTPLVTLQWIRRKAKNKTISAY